MNRIKELRKEKGMTQSELAKIVGVTQNGIGKYESGQREPKLEIWKKIAEALGVSTAYLMGLEDTKDEFPKNKKMDKFTIYFTQEEQMTVVDSFDELLSKMQSGKAFTVKSIYHENYIINPNSVRYIV